MVQAYVIAGLTAFNRGAQLRPTGSGFVIEITIRVPFLRKAVEITDVVERSGQPLSESSNQDLDFTIIRP
jgi:hypothetical protein